MLNIKQYSLIALVAAGYLGNYFSLPLFFGVDFLFGSIFVLLVLYWYGVFWGTIAGFLASIQTIFLWHHGYAVIIFTLETLVVGLILAKKSIKNLILLDAIYWLCLGIPLIGLFYMGVMDIAITPVKVIMLKQSLNGIFNALIANLIITYVSLQKKFNYFQRQTFSLQQTYLNLLLVFVCVPLLVFVNLATTNTIANIHREVENILTLTGNDTLVNIYTEHRVNIRGIEALIKVMQKYTNQSLETKQQETFLLHQTLANCEQLYMTNQQGIIIAAYPEKNAQGVSLIDLDVSDKSIFRFTQNRLKTTMLPLHQDDVNPNHHIDLTVPILTRNQFKGLVYCSYTLSNLDKYVREYQQNYQLQLIILDENKQIITSTNSIRLILAEGKIRQVNDKIKQWIPAENAAMVREKQSFYFQEYKLGDNIPWTLIVSVPAEPYVNELENFYLKTLGLMLFTIILALIVAIILSYILVNPLEKLAKITNDLPKKILAKDAISWQSSFVTEFDALITNFQSMAKALEQQFRAMEKTLEKEKQLSLLKSRFITTTSHEFRTPLTRISSSAGLLRDYGAKLSEEKQDKHLQRILKSVQQLTDLLEDLRQVSKTSSEFLKLKPSLVNLVSFSQELVEEWQENAQDYYLVFSVKTLDNNQQLNHAYMDTHVLRKILNNLLQNAIKYSPVDSTVYLYLTQTENMVIWKVRDQGIGIPIEEQGMIFESFYRGKNVGNIPGTGNGLSIVQKCVELYQGEITITSNAKQGTTITIAIPLNNCQERS